MNRLFVISPHYDDAVLSAGQLMIGHHSPTIVTVCTEPPSENLAMVTDYDEYCGFTHGAEDALLKRSDENAAAAGIVGASVESLGLVDDQYGGSTQEEHNITIKKFVDRLDRTDMVLAPLATKHPDHNKVMSAAISACALNGKRDLWLYEELPHRVLWPEEVEAARDRVKADRCPVLRLEFIGDGMMELKQAAVACYKSQLWSLDQRCIFVPERFHRLVW